MSSVTIEQARTIIATTFTKGHAEGFQPLAVVVLDAGGNVKAFEREDGASNLRFQVAHGKAYGALGMGLGSRALAARAEVAPSFVAAVSNAFGGALIPAPGGILLKNADGELIGAIGVTGDNSDNDELAGVAGIEAAGLIAVTG